eukprot:scaffold20325_cov130-Isochrysis_galbana.AAC.9
MSGIGSARCPCGAVCEASSPCFVQRRWARWAAPPVRGANLHARSLTSSRSDARCGSLPPSGVDWIPSHAASMPSGPTNSCHPSTPRRTAATPGSRAVVSTSARMTAAASEPPRAGHKAASPGAPGQPLFPHRRGQLPDRKAPLMWQQQNVKSKVEEAELAERLKRFPVVAPQDLLKERQ